MVEKVTLKPAEQLKRLDDFATEIETKSKQVDEKLQRLDARMEKDREKRVVAALRQMGADPKVIGDDDLLKIAPKVDPDEDLVELGKFRDARPGLFRKAEPGPHETLAAFKAVIDGDDGLDARTKERKNRMAARLAERLGDR